MWKGRHRAERLRALVELERWAETGARGDAATFVWSRRARRALGQDGALIEVTLRACRQVERPPAGVIRCIARVLRQRGAAATRS